FQTTEDRDEMLKSGMEKGAAETMDRFAELLKKEK
ncbi:MAG TPA: ATPase, partial [Candidatus Margulisbacteria bacterium]|nr:ATPase [Candidatus Margulisiibacteriota bacterium]